MIGSPNIQKARLYEQLMNRFQRVQERIKDIETENTYINKDTPRELAELKTESVRLQNDIRKLY
jgi:uncharacterized protein YdcH (DUF465 family)